MNGVPLREHLEALLKADREHYDQQFEDLKHEVRQNRSHKHPGLVAWAALVPLLLSLIGLIFLLS